MHKHRAVITNNLSVYSREVPTKCISQVPSTITKRQSYNVN